MRWWIVQQIPRIGEIDNTSWRKMYLTLALWVSNDRCTFPHVKIRCIAHLQERQRLIAHIRHMVRLCACDSLSNRTLAVEALSYKLTDGSLSAKSSKLTSALFCLKHGITLVLRALSWLSTSPVASLIHFPMHTG